MSDAGMESGGLPPASQEQQAAGPGASLAARRQEVGWTVEQVANQLNLAPRQVQAMEDDNYAALPGMVIARGFVRAYAKLLRLDPAPLLAMISGQAAPSPEALELRRTLSATFTESNLPVAKRSGSGAKWLAAILVLLALAGAGWLAVQEGWLEQWKGMLPASSQSAQPLEPAATENASGVPMGQATEDEGASAAAPAADPAASAQQNAQGNAAAVPPAAAAAASGASNTAAATPATAGAGQSVGSEMAAASANGLVLKLREASWVEVRRADGTIAMARLMPAGTTESFDIGQGASLVVGNAAGVDAAFRGQALDLNAGAKNNVARINLK